MAGTGAENRTGQSIDPAVLVGVSDASFDVNPSKKQGSLELSGTVFIGTTVNGKPPGFLSEGDLQVLSNYSKPWSGNPIHNPGECPLDN